MVAMKSFQFMKNRTQRQQLAQPESKREREREVGGEARGVAGRTAQPIKLMDVYL